MRNYSPQMRPLAISLHLISHEPITDLKDFDASGSPPEFSSGRSLGPEDRHNGGREVSRLQPSKPVYLGPSRPLLVATEQQGNLRRTSVPAPSETAFLCSSSSSLSYTTHWRHVIDPRIPLRVHLHLQVPQVLQLLVRLLASIQIVRPLLAYQ